MKQKRRDLYGELLEGVHAMRKHREGKMTLRTHELAEAPLPPVTEGSRCPKPCLRESYA